MKNVLILLSLLFIVPSLFSQGISINNSNTPPDGSAMLDVSSKTKGVLIPRMTKAERDAIGTPALGLMIFQTPFGFMAFLGVISLAGIVINNAIVLLDRIKIEIDELGKSEYEGIVAAAQQRFRPIILTTFTTTLGLIPLYLGGGEMWEPMAIAIMIGLLFATVITLLFVPALYKVLFRVKNVG